MSKLTAAERKAMPADKNHFAIPSKAPGPGSYPIEDASHARNALSRVSANGSPAEQAQVRGAVRKQYPGIGAKVQGRSGVSVEQMADRMHPVRRGA